VSDEELRTAYVGFRTTPKLKAELERIAKEDRRPLSQYLEITLEAHVEAKKRDSKRK
jgi:hypothetical protein